MNSEPDPTDRTDVLRQSLRSTTEAFQSPGHVSHQLLAQILSRSSQAFVIGFPDGSLGLMNEAYEKLTGYTAEELQNISWSTTLTPPEWREFERHKVEDLNRTGIPVRYEKEYIRKDGTRIPIELHVHMVPDTSGELYYFSFLTDISERKKAEQEVLAGETRFREVLDTSVHCIYRYDLIERRYDYMSPACERIMGYTVDEMLKTSIEEGLGLLHPDDRGRVRQAIEELESTGEIEVEYRFKFKDGDYRWLANRMLLVFDDEGRAIYRRGTIRDFTERKRVEDDLKQSEERFRSVLDNSVDAVYRFNYITLHYDYASPSFKNVIGYSAHEFMALSEYDAVLLVHPDDYEKVKANLSSLRPGESIEIVYRHKNKAGVYQWLSNHLTLVTDDTGRNLYRYGNVRNVTAQKTAEDRLAESKHFLARITDVMPNVLSIYDLREKKTVFINKSIEAYLGYSPEENVAMGKEVVANLMHPDDQSAFAQHLIEVHALQDNETADFEHRMKARNGEYFWFHSRVGAFARDEQGNVTQIINTSTEITERKNQELALKKAESERAELAARQQKVSETVQRSLLLAPAPDAYPGLIAQPFYQSAYDDALVGGDFYDIYPVAKEQFLLVVGDATGKGVSAATYTAEVKFALRAYAQANETNIAAAVGMLNRFICRNIERDVTHKINACVSLVAAFLNPRTGELSCTCAGAEPPLILRERTGEVETSCDFGPLLGIDSDSSYTVCEFHLSPGDSITMTTDGVTEAHLRMSAEPGSSLSTSAFFGLNGISEILTRSNPIAANSLDSLHRTIVAKALERSGGKQRDDICLLTTKLT